MRRITSVWRDEIATSSLNATARAVACALATYMNRDGVCWPSVPTIASLLRLRRRSVQRALRALQAQGFLDVQTGGGRGKTSTYTASLVTPFSTQTGYEKGRQQRHKRASLATQKGVTGDARSYEVTEGASRALPYGGAQPLDDCMGCGEIRRLFDFGGRLICRECALGESGELEADLRAVVVELREKTC